MSKFKSMSIHKIALIGLFVFGFLISIGVMKLQRDIDDWVDVRYHEHLNTEFVMKTDTLTIIDYSVLQDNFTLSDGRTISAEIVNYEKEN